MTDVVNFIDVQMKDIFGRIFDILVDKTTSRDKVIEETNQLLAQLYDEFDQMP